MKNKKGFLLGEETLKIVLAVISIGFLIYFLGALYYNSVKDEKLELAKESVEYLVEQINAGVTEIEIYNPDEWVIVNLPQDKEWICICELPNKCDPDENCAKPNKQIEVSGIGDYIPILNPPITVELKERVLSLK